MLEISSDQSFELDDTSSAPVKCVVLGDETVGKSSTIHAFTESRNQLAEPSVSVEYTGSVLVDQKPYEILLVDAPGHDEFYRLRPQCYAQTDVFLILYSCASPASFENVRTKWYPEVKHYCPKTPIILAANKVDLRTNQATLQILAETQQAPISYEQGLKLSKEIGAFKFVEYSVWTKEGLGQCIVECINASPAVPKSKKKICTLL